MSYIEYLQKTIDYIEENIKQPISIEICAETAGFSKYHFYRLFTLFVGVPFMEYVRKRRLAYAMQEVNKGRRIIDIALDFGYSSERSFCRAFQKEFADSPSKFRDKHYALPQKPVLSENQFKIWEGLDMEYRFSDVRFEKLNTMYVASSYAISKDPENDVINFMTDWREKQHIDKSARNFGFDVPVSEEKRQKGLRGYEYWIEVKEDTLLGNGVTLKKIEEGEYAVLRITNPFSNPFEAIPNGWKKLADWVNTKINDGSIKKPDCSKERYWLEETNKDGDITYMDIYFPVG